MESSTTDCEPATGGALANNPPQQQPANLSEQPTSTNLSTEACKHAEPSSIPSPNKSNTNMNVSEAKSLNDDQIKQHEDQSLDSLTSFSTAFTISFGDENSAPNKKLGIKDSIRKFAPPKPHTIEKPRERMSDCQDNSLTSIESAPAGFSKNFTRRGLSASTRSAHPTRKQASGTTRVHPTGQNINDCVALLIDRMLSDQKASQIEEQKVSNQPTYSRQAIYNAKATDKDDVTEHSKRLTQPTRDDQLNNDIRDSEIDFCEDKSDNGTYIVGADSESDAARKKIDELFGVIKSAEASVLAESRNNNIHEHLTETRQSRLAIKKLSNKERQEHINRLAIRHTSKSRSSSSSHREAALNQQQQEPPRCSSRQSNHSSDDRSSKAQSDVPRPLRRQRRSVSQSSRHSSKRNELSDTDTRSSRSSLHNEVIESLQSSAISCHRNIIKFNRTFDLRRKRLGLGEPNSRISSNASSSVASTIVQQQQLKHSTPLDESDPCETTNNLMSSQKRNQINYSTYKSSQINQHQSSSRSANFCRDDGGRFSLRMKNIAGLTSVSRPSNYAHHTQSSSNASSQNTSYDSNNYIDAKTSSPMHGVFAGKAIMRISPKYNTSTSVPCQSSDQLEVGAALSSSSRYKNQMNKARFPQSGKMRNTADSEGEVESQNYGSRLNRSIGQQHQMHDNNQCGDISRKDDMRSCNSACKLQQHPPINSPDQFKPGLNSLMISSISSLSLKICHSVCDVLVELSKKLPVEDETRLILEEIMPEVKSTSRSPTSLEEIESPHIYLARTLKNFRRIEQLVAVINNISSKIPPIDSTRYNASSSNYCNTQVSNNISSNHGTTGNIGEVESSNSDENS